ncbi:GDYXXLXY domain-containing protein [Aquimarina sp. D1M17]|uniref:GDYXXLXY domain-containing protein n=1 Tax=Aquimarina acroporae TaxID=2937283 RepID=UPI0020C07B79|nr:GDYXXLXY domain-containing protein [Aquimarina acroporae]MCK8521564.1 GDYXXLXY domain-containing protein [Aquimarina acroporae]
MKVVHFFIGFMLLALVQVFIPSQMIWQQEDILESGTLYKFKTMPIDPNDPFRGKYITLNYEENSIKIADTSYRYGDKILIYLDKDRQGFAKVTSITKELSEAKGEYVRGEVTGNYNGVINFELPFNRFYMEESKAYDAEKAYRTVNRDSLVQNVYAEVYVKEGESVLRNVIIEGVPIQEYVKKENSN